jgi:hypothetical protein
MSIPVRSSNRCTRVGPSFSVAVEVGGLGSSRSHGNSSEMKAMSRFRRYGLATISCGLSLLIGAPFSRLGPCILSIGPSALAFDDFFLLPLVHLAVEGVSSIKPLQLVRIELPRVPRTSCSKSPCNSDRSTFEELPHHPSYAVNGGGGGLRRLRRVL